MRSPAAWWIALRSSLWFVPTLVVLSSIALAQVLVELGVWFPAVSQAELPKIFSFGPEGSRSVLSSIATAMITVAGVAFSITIVSLSLASTQYSPRVLRQFMRDRANQWVLGVFVGVFAYCLTVLPRVRGGEDAAFVPAIAVAFGVVYALIAVGCLIFFIHHVAMSIQASCIVSEIAAETRATAEQLFPDPLDASKDEPLPPADDGPWHAVPARVSGYAQLINHEELLKLAVRHDVRLRMEHAVGDFIVARTPIVWVAGPTARALGSDDAFAARVAEIVTVDHTRTVEQDVMFGVRQIVDMALRALSPSLNDPTTAILCVDYLTSIVHQLATRRMSDSSRHEAGVLRIITRPPDFAALIDTAYGEIRLNAGEHVTVLGAIVRGLELLAQATHQRQRRSALHGEAVAIRRILADEEKHRDAFELRARVEELVQRLARQSEG